MVAVHHVKKAQKDQGPCGKCGKEIKAGEEYKWLKKRYGSKKIRHVGCAFRPSDHTGGRLGEVYDAQEDAQEDIENWDGESIDDLKSVLEDLSTRLEELADEYQESADNIRESFSESATADDCEEKAESLASWRDDIESAEQDLEAFDEDEDEDEDSEEKKDEDEDEDEKKEERKQKWIDDMREIARGAVNDCPL